MNLYDSTIPRTSFIIPKNSYVLVLPVLPIGHDVERSRDFRNYTYGLDMCYGEGNKMLGFPVHMRYFSCM